MTLRHYQWAGSGLPLMVELLELLAHLAPRVDLDGLPAGGVRLVRRRYCMPVSAETGLALLTGGLLGILLDRALLGCVVDFVGIDLCGWGHMFYNVADLAAIAAAPFVVLGVVQSWDWIRDGDAHPSPVPVK